MAVIYIFVFFTLIIFRLWMTWRKTSISHLPRPQGWPLFGNFFQLYKQSPHLSFQKWAKEYGPVYAVKMFTFDWVVVSGYEELHEMLLAKGRAFAGRDMHFVRKTFFLSGNDVLHTDSSVPQWNALKKTAYRALRQTGDEMNVVENILSRMAKEFIEKVTQYKNKEVDLQDDVYNFVLKATMTMITGTKPEDDNPELLDMKQLDQITAAHIATTKGIELNFMPWLRHFGHPLYTILMKVCKLRDSLWDRLWRDSQESYSAHETSPCLMHALAQLLDKNSPYYDETMTSLHTRALFIDLVIAGVITTSNSLYAFINIIIHYPHVAQRIQQEVDAITKGERQPSILDRDSMPYTVASIYELLRYTSIVFTLPHKTLENVSLGGHSIPAGTTVYPMFWALHHDEKFWQDPWIYRPERFLAADGSLLPPEHANRKHLLQFGAGIRVCVGEVFALKRLFIFITSMLQAFDIKPAGEIVTCDARAYLPGTVLRQSPYSVKINSRQNSS